MATISISSNEFLKIGIFTVSGTLQAEDILNYLKSTYKHMPHKNVLWDFSGAQIGTMSADDFHAISHAVKENSLHRSSGKSALVTADSEGYGLGRMFESIAKLDEVPVEYRVFNNIAEAQDWLAE
jgi:hypothetical protein